MIRAHVLSVLPAALFTKQFPNHLPIQDGISFSFGQEVPRDAEVLIVFGRLPCSMPTNIARERVVFLDAEPDVIRAYSTSFLNQFGLVLTTSDRALDTQVMRTNYASIWFAGVDYDADWTDPSNLDGSDYFKDLAPPEKIDKISIITSDKASTQYHRKRLAFIDALQALIPEHLDIFGHGTRSIGDKAEALLPYKYHLALENGSGPDTWTEKLADPILCWSYPFYSGCDNVDTYIPHGAFTQIDLDDPKRAAQQMVDAIQSDHWQAAKTDIATARERILGDLNLAQLLIRLVRTVCAAPLSQPQDTKWLIRSERTLKPEAESRGSVGEWLLRSALLKIDPQIELRAWRLAQARKDRKKRRRARKDGPSDSQS